MREPQASVDVRQIRTPLEQSPARRAIVLVQCGSSAPVWTAAPVSPECLGNRASEEFDLNRTLAGQPRRGPLIVLRDPSARYDTGCATRPPGAVGLEEHQHCEHGLTAAVLAMAAPADPLRDRPRHLGRRSARQRPPAARQQPRSVRRHG